MLNIIFFFLQGFQFQNLKCINLRECESITKLPNLCVPNLEKLDLSFCKNLVECHESIGFLNKLQKLHLCSCEKLQIFPSHLTWKSLDTFDISSCSSLDFFSFFFNEWRLTWYNEMKWFHGLYSYCCKMLWILKISSINYHRLRYYVYILANRDIGLHVVFLESHLRF